MPITSITRDNYVGGPGIVRLSTSDTLEEISVTNYLTTQDTVIQLLNNGPFEFQAGDFIAVSASNGNAIFVFIGDDFSSLSTLTKGETTLLDISYYNSTTTDVHIIGPNVLYCEVHMVGGGGGGGGVIQGAGPATFSAGGGGGSGGYVEGYIGKLEGIGLPFPNDNILNITIEAGGTAGLVGADGGTGGVASISWTVDGIPTQFQAFGGSGGKGSTGVIDTSASLAGGGDGANSSGSGIVSVRGTGGLAGQVMLGNVLAGQGGSSFYGGARAADSNISAGGLSGENGSGGNGACSLAGNFLGGNGGAGVIVIYDFGTAVL